MRARKDPVTGDELTAGEYISWQIQGIIRRWVFLVVFLIVTVICWSTRNDTVLLWWNLSASLLAIVIEAIVGRAMFGQTRRDAVILREMRVNTQHTVQTADAVGTLEAEHGRMLQELLALLQERDKTA